MLKLISQANTKSASVDIGANLTALAESALIGDTGSSVRIGMRGKPTRRRPFDICSLDGRCNYSLQLTRDPPKRYRSK
jgi:hypothetical protein